MHFCVHALSGVAPEKTVDLQIRGMPWSLREKLRARAKSKGLSLSRYIAERLGDHLSRPTLEEWRDELARAAHDYRVLVGRPRRRRERR